MKKLFIISAMFVSLSLRSQMDVAGIKIPLVFKSEESALILNGAGVREKYFMDLYVGALYLKVKSKDAQKVMDADESMCVKLHIVSGMITSEKMTSAVDEGFEKSAKTNLAALQSRIDQFKAVFAVKINKGDVYDLVYDKSKGTLIYKNGKLTASIPGLDFKKALFGIWLCSEPADEGLKKRMLGN
jgi:hypothetical protein